MTADADVEIEWIDSGREPRCAPDPAYPEGKDVDISKGIKPACRTELPYPAPRCGTYVVSCRQCRKKIAVTTAGRPDDPRSLTMNCWLKVH